MLILFFITQISIFLNTTKNILQRIPKVTEKSFHTLYNLKISQTNKIKLFTYMPTD